MKIFWSEKQIPELANLSDTQRKKVLRECGALWEWDGVVVGLTVLLFLGFGGFGDWFGHQLNLGKWTSAACAAVGGLMAGGIGIQIAFQRLRRVRQYLENHAKDLKTA